VNNSDSEAGYFATWSGGNRDPAYGTLDVTLTVDQLTARFVSANGVLTQPQSLADGFRGGCREGMPSEQGGGDEDKAQAGTLGQVLPGEVLAHLGVDDRGGQFLARPETGFRVRSREGLRERGGQVCAGAFREPGK
jgi:hypothetical protein